MEIPERDWILPDRDNGADRESAWEERIWSWPVSVYTGLSVHVSNMTAAYPRAAAKESMPVPWDRMVRAAKAGE